MRLLELVRRELEAEDAHLRLGGREPNDPRELVSEIRPGCRLVVRFAEPPADPGQARERLAELTAAFNGTVTNAVELLDTTLARAPTGEALTDVLADLRDATGATVALVIDRQSPVLWGCSDPALELRDRPSAQRLAEAIARIRRDGLDPVQASIAHDGPPPTGALHALRRAERAQPGAASILVAAVAALARLADDPAPQEHLPQGDEPGFVSKGFGGLYEVVLVFTRSFSPLRVEGVMRRALPVVERHVLELPPLDPTPKGGRVVPLHRD